MIGTLIQIHGIFRWVLAIVAIIVLVKYVIGWLGKGKFTDTDAMLGRLFAGAMSIQFLLGIINLIGFISIGAFNPRIHIEHTFYGLIATSLSHMTSMFRRQEDSVRFRNAALLVLIALVLIFLSVSRIRGSFFYG
jgi:hypothetical protein